MAEFCKQCADELGFPTDFDGLFTRDGLEPEGTTGYPVLCETCGPAFIIDDEGTCGSTDCDESDGIHPHGAQ